jgi:HD-GYP domain-containing protein (c-di-GMP phosphodiesterase class II)
MIDYPNRRQRQLQGGVAAAVSLAAVALTATRGIPSASGSDLLIWGMLMVGAVLAYRFPIYVRHSTKLCIFSIPLLMLAALAPPLMAAAGSLAAVLTGEMLVRKARGTLAGDVLTSASRWSLLVLAASTVSHLALPLPEIGFIAAAAVLWTGDWLTLPVLVCPITNERPSRILLTVLREGGAIEAAQYAMGVLGVVMVQQIPWAVGLFVVPAVLIYSVFRKKVDTDTMALLESTVDGVELRDPYLNGHATRVTEYVQGILNLLGMHGQEAEQILIAARLHDLGKIRLPDELILKSEALTPEDHAIIRAYPEQSAQLLAAYPDLSRSLEMIRHHHEAWDGSGYPNGLVGTDIPFGARIIAVADAFEAMTHDRPHRRALTTDQAAQILHDGRGRQWDPKIVDLFLESIGIEPDVAPVVVPEPVLEGGAVAPRQMTA